MGAQPRLRTTRNACSVQTRAASAFIVIALVGSIGVTIDRRANAFHYHGGRAASVRRASAHCIRPTHVGGEAFIMGIGDSGFRSLSSQIQQRRRRTLESPLSSGLSKRTRTQLMSTGGAEERETDFESVFDKNAALLDVPLEVFDEFHVEQPAAGSKVVEMPIFMLDLAVCPGGVVPLHIFEMRYRQMMNDISATDHRFGMLVSDPVSGKPCKYGAVLQCAQRKLLPDGRQYLLNEAVERFRVLRIVKQKPYMMMEIEVGIPDEKPEAGEPRRWGAEDGTRMDQLEYRVFTTVHSVVELMNKLSPPDDKREQRTLSEWFLRFAPKKMEEEPEGQGAAATAATAAVDELTVLSDVAENERRMKFSFAVAEMITMAPHDKQLLVQSRSTAYRLAAELEILRKAEKELAARSALKNTLG